MNLRLPPRGSVGTKLLLLIYLTVAMLAIGLGMLAFYASRRIALESVATNELRYVREISNIVHQDIHDLETYLEMMSFDAGLNEVLREGLIATLDQRKYAVDAQIRRQIHATNTSKNMIGALVVSDLSGGSLGYMGTLDLSFYPELDRHVRESDWYRQMTAGDLRRVWLGFVHSNLVVPGYKQTRRLAFSLAVTDLRRFPNFETIGYIHAVLDNDYFVRKIQRVLGDGPRSLFVVNKDGLVVASHDEAVVGTAYDDQELLDELRSTEAHEYTSIGRGRSRDVAVHVFDPNYAWYYIERIPTSFVSAGLRPTMIVVAAVLFIALVTSFFIVHLEIQRTLLPLQKLRQTMGSIGEGYLTERLEDTSDDEIGALARSFNRMMDRLSAAEREKQQKEFEVLQSQINPHFLYNTLNTIRMMAITEHAGNIRHAMSSLIRLFRKTIGREDVFVAVQDEIETLEHYVRLQQLRYREEFLVTYDIDDEVLACQLLRLTLQPIVENAIFHGVSRTMDRQGVVRIRVGRSRDQLRLTIADNGPGVDREVLSALRASLDHDEIPGNESIGLVNVHRRIRLYHGEPFGLNLSSEPGEGFSVVVKLPLLTREQVDASWSLA